MATIKEARNLSARLEERIAAGLAARGKIEAQRAVLRKKMEAASARAGKLQVLVERPGRIHISTLAHIVPAYIGREAVASILTERNTAQHVVRATDLIRAGEIKVSLSGEGTSLSLRGIAQRTRVIDAAALRRIAVARKALHRAQEAERKANAHLIAVTKAQFDAGAKIAPDLIAESVGERTAIRVLDEDLRGKLPWEFSEQSISDARRVVKAHLDHALTKSKDPCPCNACASARRKAEWAEADRQRQAKADAKAKAEAKALAKLPRVSFTCPSCGCDSVSPIFAGTGEVECQSERCGDTAIADAIKVKRVPRSTPIGLIAVPGEGAEAA